MVTYREYDCRVNRLANALLALGCRKGEKVATLSLNTIPLCESYFAVWKIGAVLVPLNPRLRGPELTDMMDHSDAAFLIYDETFKEVVESIRPRLPKVKVYVMSGRETPPDTLSFERLKETHHDREPKVEVTEDDDFAIVYTAGTTGEPKGVVLTHRNYIWGILNQLTTYPHTGETHDKSLLVFPIAHTGGLIGFTTHITRGATCVLMKAADLRSILHAIEKEQITTLGMVPALFNALSQAPFLEEYDRSSVRLVGSGGAILPEDTKKKIPVIFPKASIFDTFGMTECSGPISILRPEDVFRKVACVGKPFPHHEVRIVDDSRDDVPPGQVGEIIVYGPTVMKEYYKDPETTRMAIVDGWLYTGDLGRVDEEGYIYIVDRKKDIIISGGYNIYPKEIEEVLYSHPKVAEAAVIGVPDDRWGEAVKAVVVCKPGLLAAEEEIIDFCKGKLASYKKPTSVDFVESLPKNSVGKVLKRELRERYGGQEKGIH